MTWLVNLKKHFPYLYYTALMLMIMMGFIIVNAILFLLESSARG